MAKVLPTPIPGAKSLESLRQFVVVQMQGLSRRLAQENTRTQQMSMGGNRLTDVPDPANPTDAVNLRTLKKTLQGVSQTRQKTAVGEHYVIVWSNNGTATGTSTAPPYIINQYRTGTPNIAKLYAIGTGTGSTTLNIQWVQGGTASPVKLFTSDIVLPASANGPISYQGFSIGVPFAVNDVLYAVVTTGGGASNMSLELLVNP